MILPELMPVARRAVPSFVCLGFADVGLSLRAPIPPLALEVINATRNVQPHHDVGRAMPLSLLLRWEERWGRVKTAPLKIRLVLVKGPAPEFFNSLLGACLSNRVLLDGGEGS
jgi:hypothetical protein